MDDSSRFPTEASYLMDVLSALDGLRQNPHYHPEGDALYHSLQAFTLAFRESNDPELWAAALLHDIGKAIDPDDHATAGAEALDGFFSPRVLWLVQHHMDLLNTPRRTRHRLRNSPQLLDLERLRQWDVRGRSPRAFTLSLEDAISIVLKHLHGTDLPLP